ncbi:hypothetical protein [Deinococcus multiflagellatus]|uniref:Uncharacterized protein n=1 Tax=Deinococcus multiflagellatus TaxID=1656887 RepID=A0ABW1ZIX0_9DEIO
MTVLRQALHAAEQAGRGYEVVRNAAALGEQLGRMGRYSAEYGLLHYALEEYDRRGLHDEQRSTHLLNNLVFTSLLVGKTQGLEKTMSQAIARLGDTSPTCAGHCAPPWATCIWLPATPTRRCRCIGRIGWRRRACSKGGLDVASCAPSWSSGAWTLPRR